MEKKIGVYICNYNGRDFTINCLKTLYKQTKRGFSVYVVDNASTDDSVESIKSLYKDVVVLQNEENLGGAGGFDRALRDGIDKAYDYVMLLDNDILLEEHVVENMYNYMEANKDFGIVGSKVMIMDLPDTIQDYGNYLNFKTYKEENAFSLEVDNDSLPEQNMCDYVPTCCVMIRREALEQCGTMPVDNFIYYDDIELSYKMKLKGWKVAALGNSKVWHKGGFRKTVKNTFARYYFLRNRLNFFAKYVEDDSIQDFIEVALDDVFKLLYGFHNKGMKPLFETTMFAFDDFLHQVRGKALDYKIMDITESLIPYKKCFIDKRIAHLIIDRKNLDLSDEKIIGVITHLLINAKLANPNIVVEIDYKSGEKEFEDIKERILKQESKFGDINRLPEIRYGKYQRESNDLCFCLCNHVSAVKEDILPIVYVDQYLNCISSEEEYRYFTNKEEAEKLFKSMYRGMMTKAIKSIRGN